MKLEVEASGGREFARKLRDIGDRLNTVEMASAVFKTLEEAHKDLGAGVHDQPDTKQRWPDQVAPLDLTGELKDSLTKSDSKYAVRKMTPDTIEYGTSHPAAAFLQYGTVKMSAKRVLRSAHELAPLVAAVVRKWVFR